MGHHDTLWLLEPTTAAKHRILRAYLDAWLPIMSKWNNRLVLVDGFAGPGRYEGGEPGSPLIMLDAFLSHTYKDRITAELVYLFIEERRDRFEYLEREIRNLSLPKQIRHQVLNQRFQDVFTELLDDVQGSGANLAPTFAFVDPFGYADAPMSLTGRFLQFQRCEVLIYVPLRFVNRFILREGQEAAMDTLFGGPVWREVENLSAEESRLQFLHDLFRDQLKKECGLRFVRSFEIVSAPGTTGYHLFFGTNHPLGLERMKAAMWSVDPVAGQNFRDTTRSDQLVMFGPGDVDTGPLLRAMREAVGGQPFTIEQAEEFALEETPYLPTHVRRTLKPVEETGELEVVDANPSRKRGTYPKGTTIRFTS